MEKKLYDLLISLACHELRTPLTTISGYAQMMQKRAKNDPKLRTWAGQIQNSAGDLQNVINKLILTSDVRLGSLRSKPEDLLSTALAALLIAARLTDEKVTTKISTSQKTINLQFSPRSKKVLDFENEFLGSLPFLLCTKLAQQGKFKLSKSRRGKSFILKVNI